MGLKLVTAPVAEPLTAAECKARIGLGSEVDDATVNAWIKAERQKLDGATGWLGRALITQTWDLILDAFPCEWWADHRWQREIILPLPPLQQVVSVKYLDGSGVEQTWDSTLYRVIQDEPAKLLPIEGQVWPSTLWGQGSVTIRFRCGYGDNGGDVPEAIRDALAQRVAARRGLYGINPGVRSETVDGVGSVSYGGGAMTPMADDALRQFRVGGGIA